MISARKRAAQWPRLQQSLRADPNHLHALIELGNIYYDAEDHTSAVEYYRRALALAPANPDVRVDMAVSLFRTGQGEEAVRELQVALEHAPEHANALYNLWVINNQLGAHETAQEWGARFLAAHPEDPKGARIREFDDRWRAQPPPRGSGM